LYNFCVPPQSHRLRASAILFVCALAVAACSSAPAATPTVAATAALPTARPTITPRPTPTLAPATVPPPSQPVVTPTPIVYVVQTGDTLIPIANKFGVSVQDLVAANGNLDATRLQIGQQLIIPQPRPDLASQDGLLLPSPTPNPFEVRGLNYVRTPAGSLDILGEVFNPGPAPIGNVKVLVTLQDSAGNALQNAIAVTALDAVPVNQASPFRVLFTDPPQAYAQFVVQPLRGESVDATGVPAVLQVNNVDGKPDGVQFRVSGEIVNTTANPVNGVRLLLTVYDNERRVVGYRFIPISDQPLAPNTPLPFDASLTTSSSNIASFAALAEGIQ
jgi:LysM repeat protein